MTLLKPVPLHSQHKPDHHLASSSASKAMPPQPTSSLRSGLKKAAFGPPVPNKDEAKPVPQSFALLDLADKSQPKVDQENRDGAKGVPDAANADNVAGDSTTKPHPKKTLVMVLAADGSIDKISIVDEVVVNEG